MDRAKANTSLTIQQKLASTVDYLTLQKGKKSKSVETINEIEKLEEAMYLLFGQKEQKEDQEERFSFKA